MGNCPSLPSSPTRSSASSASIGSSQSSPIIRVFLGRQRGHEVVGLEDGSLRVAAVHGEAFFHRQWGSPRRQREVPPVSLSIPPIMLSIVLLPQPDSPRITGTRLRARRGSPLRIWICVSPWPKTLVTPRRDDGLLFLRKAEVQALVVDGDGREHGQILAERPRPRRRRASRPSC